MLVFSHRMCARPSIISLPQNFIKFDIKIFVFMEKEEEEDSLFKGISLVHLM